MTAPGFFLRMESRFPVQLRKMIEEGPRGRESGGLKNVRCPSTHRANAPQDSNRLSPPDMLALARNFPNLRNGKGGK